MKNETAATAKKYFSKGIKLLGAGNFEKATEAFKLARANNPSLAGVNEHLSLSLASLGKCDEAIEVLEQLLEYDIPDPQTCILLANQYIIKGMNSLAAITLERGLASFPMHGNFHCFLGLVRFTMGDFETAFKSLQTALRLSQEFSRGQIADIHNNLGMIYYFWGHFKKALYHFEAAESLLPGTLNNLTYLATVCYRLKFTEKYLSVCKEILRAHPGELTSLSQHIQ